MHLPPEPASSAENRRFVIVVGLISCLSLFQISCSDSHYDFSIVESEIEEVLDEQNIPSMVVSVSKDGQIIYQGAFGFADLEEEIPTTVHTAYPIASVSKPMTATGLVILHERGLVDLDAPAQQYITPLKFGSFAGDPEDVTLRHLLSHTSGLGSYFQYGFGDYAKEVADFETAFARYGTLFHPPGAMMEYANLGYGLVDYIIEKRSGQTFPTFMKRELFEPLEMHDSAVGAPTSSRVKVAKRYGENHELLPPLFNNTAGAGNIYSSAHDLMLFSQLHLSLQSPPILSHENIALMRSNVAKEAKGYYYQPSYYGLGWYGRKDDSGYETIWHEGGMPGASSILKLVPGERLAATAITNLANKNALVEKIVNDLLNVVLPEYEPEPLNVTANYTQYAGEEEYLGTWVGSIIVEEQELPCTLTFGAEGEIQFSYSAEPMQDFKEAHFNGTINENSFLAFFSGTLPADDVQTLSDLILAMHLIQKDSLLIGRIGVYNGSTEDAQFLYPFYMQLKRE